jgi:Fe-S cluster assembly ATP-binding protein
VEEKTMLWLEVNNLHVEIDGKKSLNGLDLTIEKRNVHAIMARTTGKAMLAYVLAGKTDYQVTAGEVLFDGEVRSLQHEG